MLGQSAAGKAAAGKAAAGKSASASEPALLRQDLIRNVYEVVAEPDGKTILVASNPTVDHGGAGLVYRLDAADLRVLQVIQAPRLAFALDLNRQTGALYVGNTLNGAVTEVDARTGFTTAFLQLAPTEVEKDGETWWRHARKVRVDERRNRIFVTNPDRQGLVWIVDGERRTVLHTIRSEGDSPTGIAFDGPRNRLYIGQSGPDEVLVIDPDSGQIVRQFSTGASRDGKGVHYFINLALDASGARLFAADSMSGQLFVLDTADGRVLATVPVGIGALDVVFNAVLDEIYVSYRGASKTERKGQGGVLVLDASSYAPKRRIEIPVHPNSLAVSPDGLTLYVTVKMPFDKGHPAYRKDAMDSVVRVRLGASAGSGSGER